METWIFVYGGNSNQVPFKVNWIQWIIYSDWYFTGYIIKDVNHHTCKSRKKCQTDAVLLKWNFYGLVSCTRKKKNLSLCSYTMVLLVITYFISKMSLVFFGTFAEFQRVTISFVKPVCPHATTRLTPDRFSWNLIFENFLKICSQISNFIKIWQK